MDERGGDERDAREGERKGQVGEERGEARSNRGRGTIDREIAGEAADAGGRGAGGTHLEELQTNAHGGVG